MYYTTNKKKRNDKWIWLAGCMTMCINKIQDTIYVSMYKYYNWKRAEEVIWLGNE